MTYLILGIVIFFGVHLVPIFELKNVVINRYGKKPYMAVFALISALGLGLMIYGKCQAEFTTIWQPMAWAHWVPVIVMWPISILFIWAEIPCSMKIKLRHPMLLGIVFMCISHLFANGDLASILLFASFGIYAIFTMLRQGFEKQESTIASSTPVMNLLGIIVGTLVYMLVFTYHQQITGMPIPAVF